jgi:hypothetical protein
MGGVDDETTTGTYGAASPDWVRRGAYGGDRHRFGRAWLLHAEYPSVAGHAISRAGS